MPRPFPLISLAAFAALTLSQSAFAQSHSYDLTQGYQDASGGPALTPNGGTLSSAGYTFAADQGPSLTGALTSLSNYTISFAVSLDANNGNRGNGYQKLIDFNSLASDAGLYDYYGELAFYNDSFGTDTVFVPGQTGTVTLTRDAATQTVTGFYNGAQQFQFTDTNNEAVFTTNTIRFFQDDNNTSNNESGSGVLKSITVNTLAAAPEPSPIAAFAVGLLGLGALALKAKRRVA